MPWSRRSYSCLRKEEAASLAKILIDQNIPKRVMDWLKQKGFEIVTLADVNLRGAADKKIAAFAMQNNIVVLTQDVDFAKMYHTLCKHKLAVILVNTKEGTTQSIIQALDKAQLRLNLKNVQNQLVIITKRRIRIVS
jgi:predicted nuclease of predicted toxin-antitoxin system